MATLLIAGRGERGQFGYGFDWIGHDRSHFQLLIKLSDTQSSFAMHKYGALMQHLDKVMHFHPK